MMDSFNGYIAQGNAWLFFPVAVLLGALHGLEPGHSKTMMTAFIVAIRGTVWQAFLLGISATVSHTAVIWILAFIGFRYSASLNVEELEPYFQFVTGIVVIGLACWMFYRTREAQRGAGHHEHGGGPRGGVMVDTGHGWVEISVFEAGVPPRFRLYFYDAQRAPRGIPPDETVTLETVRPDKSCRRFSFVRQEDYLEATELLPEPHEFQGVLELRHGDHRHTHKVNFIEPHHHGPSDLPGDLEPGDAHERAHAAALQKQLADRRVTTVQVILFGLTGGLLPCPAALAVLLVCLRLKEITLGFTLVMGFSVGLAVTLVTVGALAAVSVRHAGQRFKGFGAFARKIPYASSTVLILIGLAVMGQGVQHLLVK